jgi:hypothetical protein
MACASKQELTITPQYDDEPRLVCSAGGRATDRWAVRGGRTTRLALLGDGSCSEVAGAKGADDPCLEAVSTEPACTPRRRSAQREAQDARQLAGALATL